MTQSDKATDPGLSAPDFVVAPRPRKVRSLGHNSAFRFAAESSSFVLGLLGSVVAARALGPSGKGLYSSVVVLSLFIAHACYLGLGDAAMVLTGQRRASFQRALSGGIAATVVSGLAGMGLMWAAGSMAFAGDWGQARPAVLIAALGIPLVIFGFNLVSILSAQERIVAASVAYAASTWVTTFGLVAVGAGSTLTLTRTALAGLVGAAATCLVGAVHVVRGSRLSLRPSFDWGYLGPALRYGASAEFSYLLTFGFLRADLLFVYFLGGAGLAGQYSVAMTGAMVIALFPTAVSATTFPRIASLNDDDANRLLARIFRLCVIGSAAGALAFMAVAVVAIPLLFGPAFAEAVPATLILAIGGVAWSSQWVLCRGQAARGRPGLQIRSFAVSLGVMVVLDLVLIPLLGINGAALAALVAPAVGLGHSLLAYARASWWPLGLREFLPGGRDLKAAIGLVRGLVTGRGTRGVV